MRAQSRGTVILSFLLLAACGGGPEPAKEPSPPPAPTAAETAPAKPVEAPKEPAPAPEAPKALEPKPPTVKLVEPGAAPRRALRYKFKAGTTEYASMDMKMAMSMTMGPKEMPRIDLPTMRATMRLDAREVTPDGDLKIDFDTVKIELLKDTKADPKLMSALENELTGLVGLKGHSTISPRGVARDTEFELPPSASPKLQGHMDSMRDAIRNMYMPLPEEEVGKGAKWQVTSRVPVSGAAMDIAANYALESLAADSAQAKVDIVLSAEPHQRLQVGGGGSDVTATLDELTGKGSGKVSPSFVKLVGTGSTTVSMTVVSSASLGGEKVASKVGTEIAVTIRPGKAPAAAPAKK